MNKKLGYYFKKGWVEGHFVYRKLSFKQKLSLLMYLIVSAIGKLFIFTRPFFAIADENIGKMISETRDISISEAFHGANDPKKYLGLLTSYIVKDLTICVFALISLIPLHMYSLVTRVPSNSTVVFVYKLLHIVISSLAVIFVSLNYSAVNYVGANFIYTIQNVYAVFTYDA